MSRLLQLSRKRKHPITYDSSPERNDPSTLRTTSSIASSSPSNSNALVSTTVSTGFELMTQFLDNSLSCSTQKEYQVQFAYSFRNNYTIYMFIAQRVCYQSQK